METTQALADTEQEGVARDKQLAILTNFKKV
jgi:hypothetical protein